MGIGYRFKCAFIESDNSFIVVLCNTTVKIQADFILARSAKPIDVKRKEKLAFFCNMADEDIISSQDVDSIYQVPVFYQDGPVLIKVFPMQAV